MTGMSSTAETASAPWAALPVVLLAQFLAVADFFVVNVALPSIGSELAAGPAVLQFIVAGYGLAYACGLVAGGRLGDSYGRRRVFALGVGGFIATSAYCALAPAAGVLVGARIAQGIAAAIMVPQVLATIQAGFVGRDRQRALAAFGATTGLAFATGQILGGLLIDADLFGFGWRPIFLVNVPVGLLALAAVRLIPETRTQAPPPVDARGAVLLAAVLLAVLVPLTFGRDAGWPRWCWIVLGAAPVLGLIFRYDQRRTERRGNPPLLPPTLLGLPGMRRGLPVALLFFPCFGGLMLTLAVALQTGRGLTAREAAIALLPQGVAFLLTSLLVRAVPVRFGRVAITAGAAALAVGLVVVAWQSWSGFALLTARELLPAMALIGVGEAAVMVPLFGAVLAAVPAPVAGTASGVLTTAQQTGLALGAGLLGTLVFALAANQDWRRATTATLGAAALLALAAAVTATALPTPAGTALVSTGDSPASPV